MSESSNIQEPPDGGSDQRIVRALRRLEKYWPKDLVLFSLNGSLTLYRGSPCSGGTEIANFNIPSDGGDPS